MNEMKSFVKIPQRDVSQVQVYLIIIKLSQNLDWVAYNVNLSSKTSF